MINIYVLCRKYDSIRINLNIVRPRYNALSAAPHDAANIFLQDFYLGIKHLMPLAHAGDYTYIARMLRNE